jgi:hypothetical protein
MKVLNLLQILVNGGPNDYQFYFNRIQVVGNYNFEEDFKKIYSNARSPLSRKRSFKRIDFIKKEPGEELTPAKTVTVEINNVIKDLI